MHKALRAGRGTAMDDSKARDVVRERLGAPGPWLRDQVGGPSTASSRSQRRRDCCGDSMRSVLVTIGVFLVLWPAIASSQAAAGAVVVEVRARGVPVEAADVVVRGVTYRTDSSGRVTILASPGLVQVTAVRNGFLAATASVELAAGARRELILELQTQPTLEEEVTVVAATRTDKRLEDQPMRVEVLGREEIEEKMLMTPGDIVMMLNEMGGMRVQATSPALGAASVRIQGMRGRYTRVLSDGLPLFGDTGGLGLMQIPPMDLGQVEVIKGVASALHGAGAMGGVINLLSRRPRGETEREFLLNRSTRRGTDAVSFVSAPLRGRWSGSLLGGGHWQDSIDVDRDAWADMAGYRRAVVRPRFFWDARDGRTFFATTGFTHEHRSGGTGADNVLADTGHSYVEALDTRRYDAGAIGQFLVSGRYVLTARASIVRQHHEHRFATVLERDRHDTAFGEVALRATAGRQTWVAGLAVERDAYTPRDVPRFAYRFVVPAAFVQHDIDLTAAWSLSSSGRVDVHSEYGTFFSPRVSALARAGRWTSRLSVGSGFLGPTPITEETEAAGLTRLNIDQQLEAERGVSSSFDLSRTDGPLSYTATVFASRIANAAHVERSTSYTLHSLPHATTNVGLELLGTVRRQPFGATATYTYVRARETVDGRRDDVALTPRHGAGVVGMWEAEGVGRVGVEWYYTGRQRLEENPYRTTSEPYMILGVLVEKQLGRFRLFVNGENLTNVRQTRWDPLLRRAPAADGRWTVDAWAPLDGRNVNGGLRVGF
jgi:iron complex outermembrane receptor protein